MEAEELGLGCRRFALQDAYQGTPAPEKETGDESDAAQHAGKNDDVGQGSKGLTRFNDLRGRHRFIGADDLAQMRVFDERLRGIG